MLTALNEPESLLIYAAHNNIHMKLEEVKLVLGYTKGHGYFLMRDDKWNLYQGDLCSGTDDVEGCTLADLVDFALAMNEDLASHEEAKYYPDAARIMELDTDHDVLHELSKVARLKTSA